VTNADAARRLGVLVFCAAGRRLRARDEWIGWSDEQRRARLRLVVSNTASCSWKASRTTDFAAHMAAEHAQRALRTVTARNPNLHTPS
jgi:hypothetical protein